MFRDPQWIKIAALKLGMRKAAPERIPMSGEERLKTRNYFVVYLGDQEDPFRFLVRSMHGEILSGIWFKDRDATSEIREIPLSDVSGFSLHVQHYYREIEVIYASAISFLLWYSVGLSFLRVFRERTANFLFSRKTLVRTARMDILKLIVENTLREKNFRTDAVSLTQLIYGKRAFTHPTRDELITYHEFLLKSLEASGDLKNEVYCFSLGDNALFSIAKYEEENRRHSQNLSQQKALVALTLVLAFAAILQIFVSGKN